MHKECRKNQHLCNRFVLVIPDKTYYPKYRMAGSLSIFPVQLCARMQQKLSHMLLSSVLNFPLEESGQLQRYEVLQNKT